MNLHFARNAIPLLKIYFMERRILAAGAFFGMTAVILGAFGAHSLKKLLDEGQVAIFEIGVRYQFYHALLLLAIGLIPQIGERTKRVSAWLAVLGILFFSGSLYLLSTSVVTGFTFRPIVFVTPFGGILLVVAWLLLFVDFLRKKA